MGINKRLINTGGGATPAPFDPLANFETVAYTGNGGTQKINGYIRKGAAFQAGSSLNGSQISIPNTVYGASTTVFSISAWVRCTNTSSGQVPIFGNGGTIGNTVGFAVYITSGKLAMTTKDSSGESYFPADENGTVINDGDWKHVCLSYNNGAFVLYLNGNSNLTGTSTRYKNNATPTFRTFFGNRWNRNEANSVLIGAMDQIRVFNTAISSGNAATLAAETYASATKSTTDIFGNGSGVALYELDDNSNDTGVAIDSGQSGVFNGSSSFISLGTSTPLNTFGGAQTISIWIKPNTSTHQEIIGYRNDSSKQWNYLEKMNNNTVRFLLRKSSSPLVVFNTTGTVTLNQWNHIAVTVDSTSVKIYINNGSAETTSNSITSFSNSETTKIGDNDTLQGVNYFNGSIDQVRIYSSALSASDVSNLYNETSVPTPVSWYKLDGNANDSQGSNNGTWSGTEAYSTAALRTHNGEDTAINYLGMAFSPSLIWVKTRNLTSSHVLRSIGMDSTSTLSSNSTAALNTTQPTGGRIQLDSNGFTVRDISNNGFGVNGTNNTQIAWCWKAGDATVQNNDGTINGANCLISSNIDAGFSITKYKGNGTSGATFGHGLGQQIKLSIVKNLGASTFWYVYSSLLPANNNLYLNTTDSKQQDNVMLGGNTTTVAIGDSSSVNTNNGNYIAYNFADIAGYQKVDFYTGTGNAGNVGITVTTGFKPRFLLVKSTGSGAWFILDSVRTTSNPRNIFVSADAAFGDAIVSSLSFDFNSTGFVVNSSNAQLDQNGVKVLYLAIA